MPSMGVDREKIMAGLEMTPSILRGMMADVPPEILKARRIPGKWSAHEHACHLAKVDMLAKGRLERFMKEENPVFPAYLPGKTTPEDELMKMDLERSLDEFSKMRAEFVANLRSLKPSDWDKNGEHAMLAPFTLANMVRHLFLHDGVHMYRIEELFLTKELPKK